MSIFDDKRKITQAYSQRTGISFVSTNRRMAAWSRVNENDEITVEWIEASKVKKCNKIYEYIVEIAIFIVTIIFWYQLLFGHNEEVMRKCLLIISIGRALQFLLLGFLLERIVAKDSHKFHAAEHMTVNAYNKIGMVPNIYDVRKSSRIHRNCGTTIIGKRIFVPICMFLLDYYSICPITLKYYILVIVAANILRIIGVFNFLQLFNTAKPDDIHLKVAIEGVKCWDENNF